MSNDRTQQLQWGVTARPRTSTGTCIFSTWSTFKMNCWPLVVGPLVRTMPIKYAQAWEIKICNYHPVHHHSNTYAERRGAALCALSFVQLAGCLHTMRYPVIVIILLTTKVVDFHFANNLFESNELCLKLHIMYENRICSIFLHVGFSPSRSRSRGNSHLLLSYWRRSFCSSRGHSSGSMMIDGPIL